jgi:maltose alpha-D-glucosyltransferase/alpha-amylase
LTDKRVPGSGRSARARDRAGARNEGVIDRTDADWYKDAIIYQLHIKAFYDADGDGLGDFSGLIERLDYVQTLGVTAIWLLPFYPSPLRDDGYDIADYRNVNSCFGTMRDFKRFLAEAHARGLRVITELVVNHTSDQHPWFRRAREAKPGSAARNFYVWSDTDEKYDGTRIIFCDTETSNWTWDPVAKAYFWHRFYSHQPDLNFDNPRVLDEVIRVMRMWLDMGVDGMRLDAIPYLVEREGTNNENLPETHEILKKIRAAVDEGYVDRMLLAEANQWPEDVRPYFGDGDECHMGFHFPLMPRMYMALAQEDRHPITDIIRQTPDIPESCQWSIFLRNHDELTLEMVTDEERDYLWETYASDTRARINLGIRRRLAPLLENDRRKIELMNALLLSMPGTPIIYYGDELGMGDNYFLGDRDGVRTPMQWSADRNGGFSRANPQQLYLPPIMDPIYGYAAVNVESQHADPSSLLNWTRRILAVRRQHSAFGRGTISFLYPLNRKVLAYVREHEGEKILCVANLARSAQAVELDLSGFRGSVPVELMGRSAFPPIGELPYLMTLPAYGFYWFVLADESEMPRWHEVVPETLPEFITLTARGGRLEAVLEGREREHFEREILPKFLPLQRWFAAKHAEIETVAMTSIGRFDGAEAMLAVVDVTVGGETQRYSLPLTARWGADNLRPGAPKLSYTLAKIRTGSRVGALVDGVHDEGFAECVLQAMRSELVVTGEAASVRFSGNEALSLLSEFGDARPVGVEQSNVSIAFGNSVILKLYRRLRAGEQPDVEVSRFLTEVAGYAHSPLFLGSAVLDSEGEAPTTLAAAFAFVGNQGDAWSAVVEGLERELELFALRDADGSAVATPEFGFPLGLGALLGERVAELHAALATETDDPAFASEPITETDLSAWSRAAVREAGETFELLETARATVPSEVADDIDRLLARREDLAARLEHVCGLSPSGLRTRIHGDFHLGQVLVAENDLVIIDFEGEPGRSLEERRAKTSPLRDVAGMLRSFDYAVAVALAAHEQATVEADAAAIEAGQRAKEWHDTTRTAFLEAYRSRRTEVRSYPDDDRLAAGLLELFLLQKALYELRYELANRPTWLPVPIRGVLAVLDGGETPS